MLRKKYRWKEWIDKRKGLTEKGDCTLIIANLEEFLDGEYKLKKNVPELRAGVSYTWENPAGLKTNAQTSDATKLAAALEDGFKCQKAFHASHGNVQS